MNVRLRAWLDPGTGVFTRPQALRAGYTDGDIHTNTVRRKIWRRVRPGVFIESERWRALSEVDRHRVMAYAVSLRCADDLVFSHVTAAVVRRWPVWNVSLETVRAIRNTKHSGRMEAGVHHVRTLLTPDQIEVVEGFRVTSPARTMADIAREYPLEEACVLCDAALRSGACRERAAEILQGRYYWSRMRSALFPIRFADGRAESPAESRLRLALHLQGLPEPEPQGGIRDQSGRLIARVDLLYRAQRVAVEFDGKVKYGVELDGQDPRDRLFDEKLREDRIREAGFEVVRVTWADLAQPARLAARIRAAFARAADRVHRGA